MTAGSGGGWRGLVRRTPLWILVLVIAFAWASAQLGMQLLQGEEVAGDDVAIYGAFGVATGIFALWMAVRAARRERKLPPGSPTATNIRWAISTGQLPEYASAGQWVPELDKIIRQERHMMWIGPLMFGLFAALGIFLIFDYPEHPWFGVVCGLVFLGLAAWYLVWIPRRRIRIQKLIDQFPEAESLRQ